MDRRQARRLLAALGLGLTTKPTLAQVADALYAGDPADFVAARQDAAKAARASGDRALAQEIGKLRRPSVGAWYVNVAARASLVSLREWLDLGGRLREAQAGLDMARVRDLSAGRAMLEDRVVRDLGAHLSTLGVEASPRGLDEVRTTLRAALADPAAADAVTSGRLTRALEYAGFGEVDLSDALAAWTASREEAAADGAPAEPAEVAAEGGEAETAEPEAAEEPQEPEEDPGPDPALVAALEEARTTEAAKLTAQEEAQAEQEAATQRLAEAEAALAVAQRELREAKQAVRAASGEAASATKARERAERALEAS